MTLIISKHNIPNTLYCIDALRVNIFIESMITTSPRMDKSIKFEQKKQEERLKEKNKIVTL